MKGIGYYGHDFFVIKQDHDLVAESITRLVMTNASGRVDRPGFGFNLKSQLFEQFDPALASDIEENIRVQVGFYEPRADIIAVNIIQDTESNDMIIGIEFKLKHEPISDSRILKLRIQEPS
jgi:phage baseplate assembly protein W